MTSIARKAMVIAAVLLAPLVLLILLLRPPGFLSAAILIWVVLVLGVTWAFAKSLSVRIRGLIAFCDGLPDLRLPRPHLRVRDDELGDLARALSRLSPKIEEVFHGLSTELARREAILGSMAEAVLAVDSRLHVSFCNASFRRVLGTHEVPEGVPLLKVMRDPGLFEVLRRVVDSGETERQRLQMPGREDRTFEVYAAPLIDHTSRGALAILFDVTPIERLERTKRDFVANVSHEFRTPLATITGYAETLLNGGLEDDANRRRFVEIIQANSVRLNNIAADLITLSELEGGRPAADPGAISVAEVIQSALSTIEPVARLSQVRLEVEDAGGVEVSGYRIRLEQALLNLLDNAIKFNRPSGEVRVKTVASNSHVEISVSDTGIGIPPEDLSRIFERFYRVDKARSRQVAGTGLGLSIVRHAVEQMRGEIRVESEIGKGSCFTISLPVYHRQLSS